MVKVVGSIRDTNNICSVEEPGEDGFVIASSFRVSLEEVKGKGLQTLGTH